MKGLLLYQNTAPSRFSLSRMCAEGSHHRRGSLLSRSLEILLFYFVCGFSLFLKASVHYTSCSI